MMKQLDHLQEQKEEEFKLRRKETVRQMEQKMKSKRQKSNSKKAGEKKIPDISDIVSPQQKTTAATGPYDNPNSQFSSQLPKTPMINSSESIGVSGLN